MDEIVIVGGGIAGLLAANQLQISRVDFLGLERSESLGADLISGHHRFYDELAPGFFAAAGVAAEWKVIEEEASELKKGKRVGVEMDEVTPGQRFFLGQKFISPQKGFGDLVAQLVARVGSKFELKRAVHEIDLEKRVVRFLDGSERSFGKVVWCQSVDSLFKAVKGASSESLVKGKKSKAVDEGGLVLDMHFRAAFVDTLNTLVLPFRFKDSIYRALGNRDDFEDGGVRFTWTIFLDEVVLENREEVAKCVKTFKREFFKQFPAAADGLIRERIVFLPLISSGTSVESKKLELFPGVFYLGSEVHLKGSNPNLQNLDLLLENCRCWASELQLASDPAALEHPDQPTAG